MSKLWLTILAPVVIASCSGSAFQAPTPVSGESSSAAGPDNQKKLGQYIWVWHSFHVGSKSGGAVEADCPIGYVVIGGGYKTKNGLVSNPRPNQAFDGWTVDLFGSGYGRPASVTVYAVCAPTK